MNDLLDREIFASNLSALKILSYDKCNKEFMTESQTPAVSFDDVAREFCAPYHLCRTITSADALCVKQSGECILIEFKNGAIGKREAKDIQIKFLNSLLVLTDILDCSPRKTKGNIVLMLVYNSNKWVEDEEDDEIPYSSSLYAMANAVSKLAKKRIVRFGLSMLRKVYCKDVYTVSADEFSTEWEPILASDYHTGFRTPSLSANTTS